MLEFYIKILVYWSDKEDTKRESTYVSGRYKTPYIKESALNDVLLIGKALKHFASENENAVIMEINIEEIEEIKQKGENES